jgi:murein DD-endopeptidase MepM/ murein hydrolase activator NlpD
VDLAAASGTPIIASRGGRVKIATYDWSAGYYVSIDHLDGFETKYMHMTHYVVSEGEYVAPGQVIGYVGSTGTSTGPHLHFSVYYNGSSVNPANYIKIS